MRIEELLIKPNDERHHQCKKLCRISKDIYNKALYLRREAFFERKSISFGDIDKIIKKSHYELYSSIPNATSQQTIKRMCTEFDSFFKANNDYNQNPHKYKGKPKIPKYKQPNQLKTFVVMGQNVAVKENMIYLPKKACLPPIVSRFAIDKGSNKNCLVLKEIRIVPCGSCFKIEIVYDDEKVNSITEKRKVKLNSDNHLSIDMGIDVLMAVTSNQAEFQPILINGKPLKSINQHFNKVKAKLSSQGKYKKIKKLSIKRCYRIKDYLHKCSNKILQLCLHNDIGSVVIGKSKDWKQNINIGKKNNQQFVSIPFATLINQLQYKLQAYGINVILNEESYTSKADSLACDTIPTYKKGDNTQHAFSGQRKKRGLYQSSIGKLLHADINGAINILRKVIGDGFVKNLIDSGCVFQPTCWQPC